MTTVQHSPPAHVTILGVVVRSLRADDALAEIDDLVDSRTDSIVAFANAHLLNVAATSPELTHTLNSRALVLNDGAGVSLAARALDRSFPENLNGTDFTPRVLELAARRGWRVAFVGAAEGVAERAARRLQQDIPGLHVVATRHGFHTEAEQRQLLREVAMQAPDLLVVGMGCPRQELWLAENVRLSGASLGLAVGAFFDFTAGEVVRAPGWVRRMHAEWVFRLLQEPRRLARRYVVGNPVFLLRLARQLYRAPVVR